MEKLVYKSGLTTIYECDNLYKIENADGYYMFTDRDERILEALKNLMEGRRSLYYSPVTSCLYINKDNKFVCNIRQLVVAATMDGDFQSNLEAVKRSSVRVKNPVDERNFCRSNLEYAKAAEDNSLNTFWDDGEYFYIRHNPTGEIAKTDYLPPLNELIRQKRWFYSKKFRMMIATKEKNRFEFIRLHSFVAVYPAYDGSIDYEDYYNSCISIMAENDMCVDHIDTDRRNCTSSNLAIVKRNQNSAKRDITLKCNKAPFMCVAVSSGEKIGMAAGYDDGTTVIKANSVYTDFDAFIAALKDFYNNGRIRNMEGEIITLPQSPKEQLKAVKNMSVNPCNEDVLKRLLKEIA